MTNLPLSVRRIVAACEALGFTIHEASPRRLIAYRIDLRAGLDAAWTPTATGASFENALIRDPIGQPRELYYEYKPLPVHMGKYETGESFQRRADAATLNAQRQNETYNDATSVLEKQWMVYSTTGVHLWVNDLMDALGVDAKRLPIPQPRKTKQERTAAAMLAGEEIQL